MFEQCYIISHLQVSLQCAFQCKENKNRRQLKPEILVPEIWKVTWRELYNKELDIFLYCT